METVREPAQKSEDSPTSPVVVDVGIPTIGRVPRYLAEAVESVLAQTLTSWRMTISENGPGLESVARALEPYLSDPRVRHVVTGRLLPAAENATRLVRAGTAPYHGLLHDDDRWRPAFLERRVEFLEQHPECGFVFSGTVIIDEHGRPRGRTPLELAPGVQRSADLFPRLYRRYFIRVPSVLVRRSAYEAVGARYIDVSGAGDEVRGRGSLHPPESAG